jgi:hypothetical protein
MNNLLPHLQDWFLQKEEHFVSFANADSRIEGWFKAEMLVLLNRLQQQGQLGEFEREANITSPRDKKRKQVDFLFNFEGENHLCELKALCISQAAGTPRNLNFYFRDDNVGLIKDFKKLDELTKVNKWVLGFIYPSPDIKNWNNAVASLPKSLKHWQPITKPQDFPNFVFLSLWKG